MFKISQFDTGRLWSKFSRYVRSFEANCSTKAHHQMGEPISKFPELPSLILPQDVGDLVLLFF